MKNSFIVSVFSKDRVGIIADVTKAILSLDGDLGDLSQAVLNGYFTMIFVAEFNCKIESKKLRKEIINNLSVNSDGISVAVKELTDDSALDNYESSGIDENKYVMTVTSDNREGLVAEISGFLKQNQINILNLSTKVSDGQYIMMYILDLSAISFIDVLREKIKELATERKLQIVLQHNDIFRATNEIKYYK